MNSAPKIGFVGLSHLGIIYSTVTASKGFDVIAYDSDANAVDRIAKGVLPIQEPGLQALFDSHRETIRFTTRLRALTRCGVIFIARDVPTGPDNTSDLLPITCLVTDLLQTVQNDPVVVILSQVPPGFTRSLRLHSNRPPHTVFYQVETLVFGDAISRACHPERIIIGCDNRAITPPPPYQNWLDSWECPIFSMRYESAELCKIAINFILSTTVTATNTLAEICEAIGANWQEIQPAIHHDQRIGPYAYLSPGLGLSGGNLERDLVTLRTLSQTHHTDHALIEAVLSNSNHRKSWAYETLMRAIPSAIARPTVAVWGLTYKPHTHSIKNSPAIPLIESLSPNEVRVYDPIARITSFPHVAQVSDPIAALSGADALVIMTPWPEFSKISPETIRGHMKSPIIVDPYGCISPVHYQGLCYFSLGAKPVGHLPQGDV